MQTPLDRESSSAEDTRERLIRAAAQLFAEKGYEGASVKELAQEAGVNVSLVSYHFGGKDGLYRSDPRSGGIKKTEQWKAANRYCAKLLQRE